MTIKILQNNNNDFFYDIYVDKRGTFVAILYSKQPGSLSKEEIAKTNGHLLTSLQFLYSFPFRPNLLDGRKKNSMEYFIFDPSTSFENYFSTYSKKAFMQINSAGKPVLNVEEDLKNLYVQNKNFSFYQIIKKYCEYLETSTNGLDFLCLLFATVESRKSLANVIKKTLKE